MCLIHVEWFFELTAEGSDEDLVDLEFHDDIWKPPTLRALYAVTFASSSEPRVGDTSR